MSANDLLDKVKQLREITGVGFSDCKIAISDTNQTTYLQSIALNVPTIVFWNPKSTEIRKDANILFCFMKRKDLIRSFMTNSTTGLRAQTKS